MKWDVNWIHPAQDEYRSRAVVITVMKLRTPRNLTKIGN